MQKYLRAKDKKKLKMLFDTVIGDEAKKQYSKEYLDILGKEENEDSDSRKPRSDELSGVTQSN